jgi:hypothetical protein
VSISILHPFSFFYSTAMPPATTIPSLSTSPSPHSTVRTFYRCVPDNGYRTVNIRGRLSRRTPPIPAIDTYRTIRYQRYTARPAAARFIVSAQPVRLSLSLFDNNNIDFFHQSRVSSSPPDLGLGDSRIVTPLSSSSSSSIYLIYSIHQRRSLFTFSIYISRHYRGCPILLFLLIPFLLLLHHYIPLMYLSLLLSYTRYQFIALA